MKGLTEVRIPAGKFLMGDPWNEGDEDERPQHEVHVDEFVMADTQTTWEQWQEVYQWAREHGYEFDNAGKGRGPDHPVTDINWYDVAKWCNAASEMDGYRPCYYEDEEHTVVFQRGRINLTPAMIDHKADGYRMPTEAEWEKAARGGLVGHHFPWPSNGPGYEKYIDPSKANYGGNEGGTTPVKKYPPNGFGLYIVGNVWEWMEEKYDPDAYKKQAQEPVST